MTPDAELRAALQAEAEREGHPALYQRLIEMDPDAAEYIDARNVRRVIRALEVCLKTGHPISEQRGQVPPPYAVLAIGLTLEREALYGRVDDRVDEMIARGLVDEVQGLVDQPPVGQGYDWTLPALSSLGYAQLRGYLEGSASLDECVALIKRETRRFIRQQYAWFRAMEVRWPIHWLDATTMPDGVALDLIHRELAH